VRRLTLLATLLGCLAAPAQAAVTGAGTVPVSGASGTHLTAARVNAIAASATGVAAAVADHPLARWSAGFVPIRGYWVASLTERGSRVYASVTVRDRDASVLGTSIPPTPPPRIRLAQRTAEAVAGRSARVRDWVRRYERNGIQVTSQTVYADRVWTRHWWAGGQEIARVLVDDASARVTQVLTGPQVAWSMARGGDGAFGKRINDPIVFGPLAALFAIGLLDWRRLRSLRTLDVAALLAFAASLALFNQGLVFWSVPFQYPPLLYLLGRLLAIGFGRAARPAFTTRLPIWLLAGLAVFAMGFRGGLNFWSSNVVDVGYAGVAGADRLLDGRIPYGNMPKQTATPCGAKYADGTYSAYRQADGSCETPVEQGDTYGPAMYAAYVPFTAALGWSGRWDELPAAHGTAVLFDALAALGLVAAGWRLGGRRLAAAALFFWATYPFTVFAMSSNSNDAVVAAFVAWTLAALSWPALRGFLIGIAGWCKFAPFLLLPLLMRIEREPYREPAEWPFGDRGPGLLRRPSRRRRLLHALTPGAAGLRTLGGFALATGLSLGMLVALAGPHALRVAYRRTFGWQLSRDSPFSIWDWGHLYLPGFPDLRTERVALEAAVVLLAIALYVIPARLDAARVAAFGGALIVAFQITLNHWFYLYIPWFVPLAAVALLAPRRGVAVAEPLPAALPAAVPARRRPALRPVEG
jgi:hypothetical protein